MKSSSLGGPADTVLSFACHALVSLPVIFKRSKRETARLVVMSTSCVMRVVSVFCLLSIPALADLAEGKRALVRGDYAAALKEFLPLARQGNPDAQFNLGLMYDQGHGVSQDYKEASK